MVSSQIRILMVSADITTHFTEVRHTIVGVHIENEFNKIMEFSLNEFLGFTE